MDLIKILSDLREELTNVTAAIESLERLQRGRRRGRPPAWLVSLRKGRESGAPKRRESAKKPDENT